MCILDGPDTNSVTFTLYPTLKLENYIKNRLSFHIATSKNKEFIKVDTSEHFRRKKLVHQRRSVNNEIYYLDDDAYEERRDSVEYSNQLTTQDTFSIIRVSEEEKESILFVKSSLKVLHEITNVFCNTVNKTIPNDYMISEAEKILKKLSSFLFGLEKQPLFGQGSQENFEPLEMR